MTLILAILFAWGAASVAAALFWTLIMGARNR